MDQPTELDFKKFIDLAREAVVPAMRQREVKNDYPPSCCPVCDKFTQHRVHDSPLQPFTEDGRPCIQVLDPYDSQTPSCKNHQNIVQKQIVLDAKKKRIPGKLMMIFSRWRKAGQPTDLGLPSQHCAAGGNKCFLCTLEIFALSTHPDVGRMNVLCVFENTPFHEIWDRVEEKQQAEDLAQQKKKKAKPKNQSPPLSSPLLMPAPSTSAHVTADELINKDMSGLTSVAGFLGEPPTKRANTKEDEISTEAGDSERVAAEVLAEVLAKVSPTKHTGIDSESFESLSANMEAGTQSFLTTVVKHLDCLPMYQGEDVSNILAENGLWTTDEVLEVDELLAALAEP